MSSWSRARQEAGSRCGKISTDNSVGVWECCPSLMIARIICSKTKRFVQGVDIPLIICRWSHIRDISSSPNSSRGLRWIRTLSSDGERSCRRGSFGPIEWPETVHSQEAVSYDSIFKYHTAVRGRENVTYPLYTVSTMIPTHPQRNGSFLYFISDPPHGLRLSSSVGRELEFRPSLYCTTLVMRCI